MVQHSLHLRSAAPSPNLSPTMGRGTRLAIVNLVVLFLSLAGFQASANGRAAPEVSIDHRASRSDARLINDDWRFLRADTPEAKGADFDDNAWARITLPHTWNATDGTDGGNNYYRGACWYRRPLDVDAAMLAGGRRVYLRFGAASLVADVYVNGTHVGQHRGGFAAFCFDVTDQLRTGKNLISVRVDNTRVDDVAPQSGDFTVFGGLYREIELITAEPLHVSPVDDGSSGICVKQVSLSDESATIDVVTKVRNKSATEQKNAVVTVAVAALTREGVARPLPGIDDPPKKPATTIFDIAAGADADVTTRLVIDRPRLWNGVLDPNVYHILVSVNEAGTQATEHVFESFGLRTFKVDPERGLSLNGRPYAVRGVNTHQEVPAKGWAGSRKDYEASYALVREMGATAVRMAHYQHHPYEYSLCDENGLVVWAEVPLVDKFGPSPAFGDNVKQQLRELIKQNRNHPSILFWGLWNELQPGGEDPNWNIVRECNVLAHELDPSRVTTAAHHLKPEHPAVNIPDTIAFNRYAGWYGGGATEWPFWIDDIRRATPGRPLAISEYGAGASIHQHELHPARVVARSDWHPEEYQSLVHEQAWLAIKARPYLWGTFVWNMFDFSADQRREGDHLGRNDKGLVTIDQKTRKDAYYFYQANWTSAPMVHITSARFDPYPIGKSDVKVYSNCDKVELIVNGKSQGKENGSDGIFIWPDVNFPEGPSTVVARGTKDDKTAEDVVRRTVSRAASTRTTVRPPSTAPPSDPTKTSN
jgi:beta-galactosidase